MCVTSHLDWIASISVPIDSTFFLLERDKESWEIIHSLITYISMTKIDDSNGENGNSRRDNWSDGIEISDFSHRARLNGLGKNYIFTLSEIVELNESESIEVRVRTFSTQFLVETTITAF